MKFDDFALGQTFAASMTITKADFDGYISFARTRNMLHEDPGLAAREGIKGTLLPGRAMIARAEGEMTRLPASEGCVMLLYRMDGDPEWVGRQTRFLGEAYAGDALEAKYTVAGKKDGEKGYGILRVDYEISKEGRPIVISKATSTG